MSCWVHFFICPTLAGWSAIVCISVNPFHDSINLSLNNTVVPPLSLQILLLTVPLKWQIIAERQDAVFLSFFLLLNSHHVTLPSCYFYISDRSFGLSGPSGEARSDSSFTLNPCFCHAKLTASLWVNAACKCWEERGVSEWETPVTATWFPTRLQSCRWSAAGLMILTIWERSDMCFI